MVTWIQPTGIPQGLLLHIIVSEDMCLWVERRGRVKKMECGMAANLPVNVSLIATSNHLYCSIWGIDVGGVCGLLY